MKFLREEKKERQKEKETTEERGEGNERIQFKRRQEGRPEAGDHFVPNVQTEMGEF